MRLSIARLALVSLMALITMSPPPFQPSATTTTASVTTTASTTGPRHHPSASTPPAAAAPGGTAPSRSPGDHLRWGLPVDGQVQVLRPFAPPSRPWLAGHRGTDLAVRPGQRVRAAGPGVVGYAGPFAGRGVVMITHPEGLRTTYLPVHAKVRRGQTVKRGQIIGTIEGPASHCASPCLHWGLIHTRRYLDPLLLVALGQVRLLPHWPATP
ncbi:murein hydrolase activator EnvC family protein [Sphaerisporangium dianthi]|uniref:Murein hydrolase activator EnvC family protein n=1 Tax=Sphaerisporangium dianthi TaxID=1436120 RepID=A0ABV9CT79_9ACTN